MEINARDRTESTRSTITVLMLADPLSKTNSLLGELIAEIKSIFSHVLQILLPAGRFQIRQSSRITTSKQISTRTLQMKRNLATSMESKKRAVVVSIRRFKRKKPSGNRECLIRSCQESGQVNTLSFP